MENKNKEKIEEMIDKAIEKAIANLALEGMLVNDLEKQRLKEEFLNNYKIKILKRK